MMPRRATRRSVLVSIPFILLIFILTIWPVISIVFASFTTQKYPGMPEFNFTWKNFEGLITYRFYRSLANTLTYTIGKTVFSVALGLLVAWLVARTNLPWKSFFAFAPVLTILLPSSMTTMGLALLLSPKTGLANTALMSLLGLQEPVFNVYSMQGMILSGVLHTFPLNFLIIYPALRAMNPELEESARLAGSAIFSTTLHVTFRLVAPAVLITTILGIIRGLEALTPALFLGIPAGISVLVLDVFESVQRSTPPDYGFANALAVVLLATTGTLMLLYTKATSLASKYVTVTGKHRRFRLIDLGVLRIPVFATLLVFYGFFAVLPISVIFLESLMPFSMPWEWEIFQTLTAKNYVSVIGDSLFPRILSNTLILVVLGSVLCMTLGIAVAYATVRSRLFGKRLINLGATLTVAIPAIVIGLAILWVYVATPLYLTVWIMIIALVVKYIPFAVALTSQSMFQISNELEESSRVCGATWMGTFGRVMFPLLSTSYFSGLIYLMIRAMGELEVVILLRGIGNEVFSTRMWGEWSEGSIPTASVVAITMVSINFVLYLASRLVGRRIEGGFRMA